MTTTVLSFVTGAQTPDKQRRKVQKQEAKALLVTSKVGRASVLFPLLVAGEAAPYSGCWLRTCTASWRTLFQPSKLLPPSWHSGCILKRPPADHVSCFRLVGDHDTIRAFQKHGPTLALTISSSSKAMWKKAFCNSMDGSFGERITTRIGKFTPGISVCPSNKTSTNFQHCGHSATSALAGHAGNGTTPATQCWCLLKEERACFSSPSGVQSTITVKGKAWQPSMRSVRQRHVRWSSAYIFSLHCV